MIQNNLVLVDFGVENTYLSTKLVKQIVDFCEKRGLNIIYITGIRDEYDDYPRLYTNNFHILNKDSDVKIIISIIFDETNDESILQYTDYNNNIEESFNNYIIFEKALKDTFFII